MSETKSDDNVDNESNYIRTAVQNYISRDAIIHDPARVHTKGKSIIHERVVIYGGGGGGGGGRGVHIGRYCKIGAGSVLQPTIVATSSDPMLPSHSSSLPPSPSVSSTATASPPSSPSYSSAKMASRHEALSLVIGNHTHIGERCRIESLSVGSSVRIGNGCRLMPRSVIKDCVVLEDGAVVPPDMIVPPFSRVKSFPLLRPFSNNDSNNDSNNESNNDSNNDSDVASVNQTSITISTTDHSTDASLMGPCRIVGCLPESAAAEFVEMCIQDYIRFVEKMEVVA